MITIKSLLVAGTLLIIAGCSTPSARVVESRSSYGETFALYPPSRASLAYRDCMRKGTLFTNCGMQHEETRSVLADGIRENIYDQVSDKLLSGFSGKTYKKNRKSRWRLKRSRVEWQYTF